MPKKRVRGDMKVSEIKHRRAKGIPIIKRGVPQPGITKQEFMDVLTKASQPVEHEGKSD
jgi:hypothetical protein